MKGDTKVMNKFNIDKSYMDLSPRELKITMDSLEMIRKPYEKFFKEKINILIANSRDEFKSEIIGEEIYNFYLEEIEEYFKLGYALGRNL